MLNYPHKSERFFLIRSLHFPCCSLSPSLLFLPHVEGENDFATLELWKRVLFFYPNQWCIYLLDACQGKKSLGMLFNHLEVGWTIATLKLLAQCYPLVEQPWEKNDLVLFPLGSQQQLGMVNQRVKTSTNRLEEILMQETTTWSWAEASRKLG